MAEEIRNPMQTTHFDEEELMLYLDGELPAREAELVVRHLPVCPDCNQKWTELRETSLACDQFLQEFAESLPAPPHNWEGFENQIRESFATSQEKRPSWGQRFAGSVRGFTSGPLLPWTLSGAAAAVAMVFLFMHPLAKPSLSINDVLSRCEQASATAAVGASPVVYQKLRITDSAAPRKAVTVQFWSDRKLGRFREAMVSSSPAETEKAKTDRPASAAPGEPEQLLRDLHAVYEANQLPANAPFSAQTFRGWTETGEPKQEGMREDRLGDGEKIYRLSAQAVAPPANSAADAPFLHTMELLVRASDWHAVAQRLTVSSRGSEHTYEIAELEYRLISPSQVPGNLFGGEEKASAPVTEIGAQTFVEEKPSQMDLAVEALERLDRVDALMQDQITVTRTGTSGVQIHGTVRNEARKAEIMASLGNLTSDPVVKVNLISAMSISSSGASQLAHPIQMQSVEVQINPSGSIAEVRSYLSAHRALTERELDQAADRFVTDAVGHSSAAQLHAQVLKSVVEIGAFGEAGFVPPQTRERLRVLVGRHAQASLREAQALEQQLAPVFGHNGAAEKSLPAEVATGDNLPTMANLLLSRATEGDRMLWQAFSSNASSADRNALTDVRFWIVLKEECALAAKLGDTAHP